MQQIQQLLRDLIERQESLYEKVNAGDFSEVCYQEQQDERYGTYDKNYTNRLRLVFYLFYGHKGEEKLVAALFEEELKDRETNSFQGIGGTLEYLTVLLREYNQEGKYDALFERAENANFDCACGYRKNLQIDTDINTWDVEETIVEAIEMHEFDIAKKLIQIWQDSISEWDSSQIKELISYNRDVGWEERNEELLEKYLDLVQKTGKNGEIISAWHNLIKYQIQFEEWDKAYQSFAQLRQQTNLEEDLSGHILEQCVELINHYPQKAQELWDWCKPYLQKMDEELYGNLYKKSICAAKIVGDAYALELEKKYRAFEKRWKE